MFVLIRMAFRELFIVDFFVLGGSLGFCYDLAIRKNRTLFSSQFGVDYFVTFGRVSDDSWTG